MWICTRPKKTPCGFSACGRGSEVGRGVEKGPNGLLPQTQSGGSWVMFVNTHWGLILCTLYMLRTVCLLLCFPVHSFSLSLSQGLRWNCSSCLCLFLITLYSPRTFYPVVSRNTHPKLTAVSPPPLLLPPLPSSLHYRLWSAVTLCIMVLSLCMDFVPVTLCLRLYSEWGLKDLTSAIPKQKSKYLTFDKCRYQRYLSVLCLSLSFSPFHPAACVLRDKPSTGFSPSLSDSKA